MFLVPVNLDIWHSEDEPRLTAVLAECWHLLSDGAADPQHDFHTTALGTTHGGLGCTLRTVVLRKVDAAARLAQSIADHFRDRPLREVPKSA